MRHQLILFGLLFGSVRSLLGQPSNVDCASAALLCAGQPISGNNTGVQGIAGYCANTAAVLWYTFSTNSQGGPVMLTVEDIDCPGVPGMDDELSVVVLGGDGSCEFSSFFAVSACGSDGSLINSFTVALSPYTQYWVLLAGVQDDGATSPAQCGYELTVSGTGVDVIGVDMSAGPDVTINVGETTQLQGIAPNADWQPAMGLSATNIPDPIASPDNTTLYTLTAVINGCTFTDDVLVTVTDPSSIGQVVQTVGKLPFPDPGSDHFILQLPAGPHTITLFNAAGRRVLQQRTSETRPVIATAALPQASTVSPCAMTKAQ